MTEKQLNKTPVHTDSDTQPNEQAERIIDIAAGLFAEHGFDAVSTRQIASAVGLSIATVNYHVGGKRELYDKVIGKFSEQESKLVRDTVATFNTTVKTQEEFKRLAVILVDGMVELTHTHPARARLYMRRWLDPEDSPSPAEKQRYIEMYDAILGLVEQAKKKKLIRADFDFATLLRSFDWMIYSYFVSGSADVKTWCGDPMKQANLDAFKDFLHTYIFRMTGLD